MKANFDSNQDTFANLRPNSKEGDNLHGDIAECYGVKIPFIPVLGKNMVASLAIGNYERNEILCALEAIPKRARILELGAGVGVVGAVMARNCDPEAIMSFEANPALLPHISKLHIHNGLDQMIRVQHGVVLTDPDAPSDIDFYIRGNFLGSGLGVDSAKKSVKIKVPVVRYDAILKDFPHNVIMMDIEGGELGFLTYAELKNIEVYIAEFHPGTYGRDGMHKCHSLLESSGMTLDHAASRGRVRVYRRLA